MVHEQLTLLLLGERLIGTVSQHLGTVRRYLSSSILCPHSKGSRKDCADQSYHKRRCFPTIECILDSVSTKSPPWTVGTAEALPLRFGENKQRISSLNRKQKMRSKWQGLETELCEMPVAALMGSNWGEKGTPNTFKYSSRPKLSQVSSAVRVNPEKQG